MIDNNNINKTLHIFSLLLTVIIYYENSNCCSFENKKNKTID